MTFIIEQFRFKKSRENLRYFLHTDDNWDRHQGRSPSSRTIKDAENILRRLEITGVNEPRIMLSNDGKTGIYWRLDHCYLEIGLIGDGQWNAYGIDDHNRELMIDGQLVEHELPNSLIVFLGQCGLL